MPTPILMASQLSDAVMDVAREILPPGYELIVGEFDSAEFAAALKGAEYYVGSPRFPLGPEFYRAAPQTSPIVQRRLRPARPRGGAAGPCADLQQWRLELGGGRRACAALDARRVAAAGLAARKCRCRGLGRAWFFGEPGFRARRPRAWPHPARPYRPASRP